MKRKKKNQINAPKIQMNKKRIKILNLFMIIISINNINKN